MLNTTKQRLVKAVIFERCTKNKAGRLIERSEHMDLIEANKKRLNEQMELYRKRQAIVEHPYGVIKRQWDFYYIMTKNNEACCSRCRNDLYGLQPQKDF